MRCVFKILVACFLCAAIQLSARNNHLSPRMGENIGYGSKEGPVSLSPYLFSLEEVNGETTTIFLGTAVSPSIAVNPENPHHLVACWQQDRISNAGSLELGIAHSHNSGRTWRRTTIPLQIANGGINQRISNAWLSYSRDGSIVYLTALVLNANQDPNTLDQSGVIVAVSKDNGKTWGIPRFVAASQMYLNEPARQFPLDDKPAVTADRNEIPNAYVVWDRFLQASSSHSTSQISRTYDFGKTWTPFQTLYDPFPDLFNTGLSNGIQNDCSTINNIVVVQPKGKRGNNDIRLNGELLNFMVRLYAKPGATNNQYENDQFPYQYTLFDIALVRSKDFGVTWETTATVVAPFVAEEVFTGGYTYNGSQVTGGVGTRLRSGDQTPSYNGNPKNGNLYVVWQTGQFRSDQLSQIALSTSRNGGHTWSTPVKVSRTPVDVPNPQAFSPFVAITKDGFVGVLYYDFRNDDKTNPEKTKTDTWLAVYREVENAQGGCTGVGLEFVKEYRLSFGSFIAQNGPVTTLGVMTTGDYPFLVAENNHFYGMTTETFKGPFTSPEVVHTNSVMNSYILLDSNFRQAPFFNRIKQ